MAEEIAKAEAQEEQIKVKFEDKQTDIPSLYVNNAQFSMTEWDVRIDLGELHSVSVETKTMFVVPKLRLLMTPDFAQRFSDVLAATLERRKKPEEQTKITEVKSPEEPKK